MTRDRDIAAFDARAGGYEGGRLGRLHQQLADRTAELALTVVPAPQRILDVGRGTGYLLRRLAARCPEAVELTGVDPARAMIAAARAAAAGGWLVLTDLFSAWLSPTLVGRRRDKARTQPRASRLLAAAGFLAVSGTTERPSLSAPSPHADNPGAMSLRSRRRPPRAYDLLRQPAERRNDGGIRGHHGQGPELGSRAG